MNRIFTFWMIISMLVALPAYTQIVNITSIKPNQSKPPGKHYNFVFNIDNSSHDTLYFKPNIILPPSWRIVTKKSSKYVKPQSNLKFFFAAKIPKDELSQKFKVKFNISDPTTNDTISNTSEITVFVEPLYDLSISIVEQPDFVLGEQVFTCKYALRNSGNTIEKLKLSSDNGKLEESNVEIPPGEEKIVTIEKKALQVHTEQPAHTYIELGVFSQNQNKAFKEIIDVTVYPSEIIKDDPYLRYPITANVITNFTSNDHINETSIQYRLSGSGSLDLENKHHLKFNLESPVSKEFQKIGRIRQTKAIYEGPQLDASIGDIAVNVSRLTEESRSGLGLKVKWKEPKYNIEGFYIKPQFFDEFAYEIGSIARYIPNKKHRMKANWIHQISKEGDNNTLFSLQSEHKKRKIEIFPELALSYSGNDFGYATSVASSVSKETWNFNSSFLYANSKYSGYYSNSIHYRVSAFYKITKRFSLNAGSQLNKSNIRFDNLTQTQVPIVKNYNFAIKYNMKRGHSLAINSIFRSKEDRAVDKSFDYDEYALKLDYGFKYRDLTINLNGALGETISYLEEEVGDNGSFYSSKMKMNLKLSKKSTMTAFASYLFTNRYSSLSSAYWYYGANFSYNFTNRIHASGSFTNDYTLEETYLLKSYFSFSLNYSKESKLIISSNLDYAKLPGSNNRQLFTSLNLKYIFNAPLYKRYAVGHIIGRLVSKGDVGVPKTIVKLDNKIRVTNSNGEFDFSNQKIGPKKLSVDQSRLELGEIILETTPMNLDVQPNETIDLNLHVIKSAKIRGYVNFIESKQKTASKYKLSRPESIIELKNENETITTTSNRRGEFIFTNIKPGTWEISIYDEMLKKDFTIKNNYQKVEIEEGIEKSITFNMSQKKRKVHFKKSKVKIKL